MTRQVRKRFLIGATAAAQLILLVHLTVLLYIYITQDALMSNPEISSLVPHGGVSMILLNLALQAALCSGVLLGLYLFFRKTPSAEVFFFHFALLGFALSSLRILALPLSLQLTSLFSLQPFSKLIMFGRFFTILCLFLSGLFSTGLTFQKQGGYLLIVFVIALIISTLMPLDCTTFHPALVCRLGQDTGFSIAYYLISAFAVLNYVYASSLHSSRDYTFNALALLLVIAGMEICYHWAHLPAGIAGALLIAGGAVIFAQRTHAIYQWF
ncbi:MAG: hypothetical protein SVR04_11275 [Spirochaetota bacterium]|nr:hypothetical protein [Spirochaetota bacterium]